MPCVYLKSEFSKNRYVKVYALLKTNEFFGDESIFNEQPRSYFAIANDETLLLSINRTNLLTIISECPSIAVSLLNKYALNIKNRHFNEN